MLIQFTRDFQSQYTGEQFYMKGDIIDSSFGNMLISEGVAVAYEPLDSIDLDDDSKPDKPAKKAK